MLNLLFTDSFIKKLATKITWQVQTDIAENHSKQDSKLNLILQNIEKLHVDMKTMEERLTKKEMSDRLEYGQLKYKIASLETDIRPSKRRPKDLTGSH